MLPLTVKCKEASFVVVVMIEDSQLRMRDNDILFDDLSPLCPMNSPPKEDI